MNVTKSGTAAAAAEPISVDVTSADNSVVITKTEENKKTSFDLSVTKEKPVEVVGSDPKIVVTKVSDLPTATYFLLTLNDVFSKAETAAEIDKKLVGVYKVKGSATLDEIKAKHAEIGDVYNCTTEGELNGEPVYPGDNIVAVSQTEHGLCNWDNLHGSITVASPSVELTSSNNTIAITKTEGADNKVTFDIACTGASPEGDFITKSGSFFYDTFSRERRTTEKEYEGTVYQPTVGEKSICISSAAENGSIVSGANSHVEGDENIVTGENSFVLGDNNIVKGPHNYVLGYGHRLASEAVQFGFVAGNGHDLGYSFGASVSGLNNTVNGHCPVALGQGNKVGPYSVVLGHTNDVSTGEHHVTIGTDNKNTGNIYGFMIGQGNNSNVTNSILLGFHNGGTINSFSTLIGSYNEGNSLPATSVLVGHQNQNNTIYSGTMIVGHHCNNFSEDTINNGIVLGGYAKPQLIDVAPLCLAIGNGDYYNPGNCIAADRAGNVKLYGNVLFDVDGVQYSMKQIVDALKSLNAL